MFKFRLPFRSLLNFRNLFLATVPAVHLLTQQETHKCWFFNKKYARNRLQDRVQTVQYNANSPIEDRISYRDLASIGGFAALVLDGHGGWQAVRWLLCRPSSPTGG